MLGALPKRGYSDSLEEMMENKRYRGRIITNNWQIIDVLFGNVKKKWLLII